MSEIACPTCGESLTCEGCELPDLDELTDEELETMERLLWKSQPTDDARDRFEVFLSGVIPEVSPATCARCGEPLICVRCSGGSSDPSQLSDDEWAEFTRLYEKAKRAY
jgi:hypothetical protein